MAVEKEKVKLGGEEREQLADFFYSVYEFLMDGQNFDAMNFLCNSPTSLNIVSSDSSCSSISCSHASCFSSSKSYDKHRTARGLQYSGPGITLRA